MLKCYCFILALLLLTGCGDDAEKRVPFCEIATCNEWEQCSEEGKKCITKSDRCVDNSSCSGGKVCDLTGHICDCPDGYTGDQCEINQHEQLFCDLAVCDEWTQCSEAERRCVVKTDRCIDNSDCSDGKICDLTKHICDCAEGFTGDQCNINIDDCGGVFCQNGGECIDGINSYICKCESDFTGDLCEFERCYSAGDRRCSGSGIDICSVEFHWEKGEACNETSVCSDLNNDVACVDKCFHFEDRCMPGQGCDPYTGFCTGVAGCGDSIICEFRSAGIANCTESSPGFWNNDQIVTVIGVVTGILGGKYPGLYIQERGEVTRPYQAIFISLKQVPEEISRYQIGDLVTGVDLNHVEYYCFPQLEVSAAEQLKAISTVTIPEPARISIVQLEDRTQAEQYEAALITVTGGPFTVVQAGTADNYFETIVADQDGDQLILSTAVLRFGEVFTEGYLYNFNDITGNLIYSYGKYRLQPRISEDIHNVF